MNVETKDIITLNDNNKYVVCSKVNYQNNGYLYLVDVNDKSNVKFGLEEKADNQIKILEIENQTLIQALLPLFYSKSKEILSDNE